MSVILQEEQPNCMQVGCPGLNARECPVPLRANMFRRDRQNWVMSMGHPPRSPKVGVACWLQRLSLGPVVSGSNPARAYCFWRFLKLIFLGGLFWISRLGPLQAISIGQTLPFRVQNSISERRTPGWLGAADRAISRTDRKQRKSPGSFLFRMMRGI